MKPEPDAYKATGPPCHGFQPGNALFTLHFMGFYCYGDNFFGAFFVLCWTKMVNMELIPFPPGKIV